MKIVRFKKEVEFCEIQEGEVFSYQNLLFIKTNTVYKDGHKYVNSVRLDNGLTNAFSETEKVSPVNCRLLINDTEV